MAATAHGAGTAVRADLFDAARPAPTAAVMTCSVTRSQWQRIAMTVKNA